MKSLSIKSPAKLASQVALAGVMALGLTAAVSTFASSGKTGLTVITHVDNAKIGKLNERLSGVQYQPTCTADSKKLTTGAGSTDGRGTSNIDLSYQITPGQKVTCSVTVPKKFSREGKTYTLAKGENSSKSTLFKSDITSVVRFSYQVSE